MSQDNELSVSLGLSIRNVAPFLDDIVLEYELRRPGEHVPFFFINDLARKQRQGYKLRPSVLW